MLKDENEKNKFLKILRIKAEKSLVFYCLFQQYNKMQKQETKVRWKLLKGNDNLVPVLNLSWLIGTCT